MSKESQIYKCNICGNIVEVLHDGGGELVCCGQVMQRIKDNFEDQGQEKHLPVIEVLTDNSGVKVKIGEVEHPMLSEHYIEWIEIITDDNKRMKKFLNPGDKPEAEFQAKIKVISARSYCNIHGLWKTEN